MDMVKEISRMKQEKDALIVAHYYQPPEIQEIADFVGDSFELARKARDNRQERIVFCGVHFMAESAKILSPDKRVLLPTPDAGCPMADMVDADAVRALRAEHPGAAFVCYVNTSAEVKAECDACCTSSNAMLICSSLPQEEIVFLPDKHLGSFVANRIRNKKITLYDGCCPTHIRLKPEDVLAAREQFPDAPVLVHPECPAAIVELADFAGSTAQILNYARNSEKQQFLIGTEAGILHQLQKDCPDKEFYLLTDKLICHNMKKTTLEEVYRSLKEDVTEITLDEEIIRKARKSLDTMMEIVESYA